MLPEEPSPDTFGRGCDSVSSDILNLRIGVVNDVDGFMSNLLIFWHYTSISWVYRNQWSLPYSRKSSLLGWTYIICDMSLDLKKFMSSTVFYDSMMHGRSTRVAFDSKPSNLNLLEASECLITGGGVGYLN